MRIALITPGFSADEEDWCIPALITLVRALTGRQHEVEIFTLRYPPRRDTYSVSGTMVHPFGGGGARGIARLPLMGKALAQIIRRHRRRPFDVLHAMWA